MFGIVITPFWLIISVVYFGLGVLHWRLSERVRVVIEFLGKDELWIGKIVEDQEKEHREIAYLTKRTLKLASVSFFVAFAISLYQSISEQWQIALDSSPLVVIVTVAIIVVLIVVYLSIT